MQLIKRWLGSFLFTNHSKSQSSFHLRERQGGARGRGTKAERKQTTEKKVGCPASVSVEVQRGLF